MARRRAVADIPATPHFAFMYGTYALSSWTIPYLSTTMGLADAADNLRLTGELPGSERINWKLTELYQRDIDWPRVERKIVPYLRNPNTPQFFNALTIALLPYDRANQTILDSFSGDHQWSPPPLMDDERFAQKMTLGPLSLGYWNTWESVQQIEAQTGELRWNPQEVFAVALDGQHRLAAIKSIKPPGAAPSPNVERTRVPVLLLVFDPSLGFVAQNPQPLVEVLRVLFIDLNKHAKTPSRARQILLDDRDPHAVCVRAIVGEKLRNDTGELDLTLPRFPLSLVDWHSEQAKFDEGPYLSTVLGLDWMVSMLLGTKPIGDSTDYNAVGKQINRLQLSLGVDLAEAQARLSDVAAIKLSPFTYSGADLAAIERSFRLVWNLPLTVVLSRFAPYDALVKLRETNSSFGLDFLTWYKLYERKQKDRYEGQAAREYHQFLGRLSERQENPIGQQALLDMLAEINELKSRNLAFNVAFQRAYVEAFVEFAKIKDRAIEELVELGGEPYAPDLDDEDFATEAESEGDEQDEDQENDEAVTAQSQPPASNAASRLSEHYHTRAEQFVAIMNRLLAAVPEVTDIEYEFELDDGSTERFWLGTLLKPEGGIDFTQGASKRARDLIFLCAAMALYDDIVEPDEQSDFDEFWSEATSEDDAPALVKVVRRAVKRFADKDTSAGARILRAKDEDYSVDDARDQLYYRLGHVWVELEL